jgi:predicted  nucleic acid-binding Zn-ribbon protein
MLTELETLSKNIGRLIEINQRHQEARVALEEQLAHARAECEAARVELEQTREERNALHAERDALSAKIDDAQVRLNAILEKLPRARANAEPDSQLDLLAPAPREQHDNANGDVTRHGENA